MQTMTSDHLASLRGYGKVMIMHLHKNDLSSLLILKLVLQLWAPDVKLKLKTFLQALQLFCKLETSGPGCWTTNWLCSDWSVTPVVGNITR